MEGQGAKYAVRSEQHGYRGWVKFWSFTLIWLPQCSSCVHREPVCSVRPQSSRRREGVQVLWRQVPGRREVQWVTKLVEHTSSVGSFLLAKKYTKSHWFLLPFSLFMAQSICRTPFVCCWSLQWETVMSSKCPRRTLATFWIGRRTRTRPLRSPSILPGSSCKTSRMWE